MTVEHNGAEDIDRALALLWHVREQHSEPARGRRPRLAVGRIVEVAIGVADAEGLVAASMHRVAKELGAGTMTLYTYVPGKAELLDLMVDQVLAERLLPGPGDERPADWRAQVLLYSDRTRETYRRHPWLREASRVRPALGPGHLAGQEYLLSTLDSLGLGAAQVTAAAGALGTYIDANAALEAESAHLERVTGQSDDAWWDQRSVFWHRYFPVDRHPTMARVWESGGFVLTAAEQAAQAYDFGLNRLLDGIEELVA
ncbi:TetR/AcrR family transcriptional regulator [Amycolatopsis sp. NPDC058986]|uniref:TetR/AcrR family transcriptional regulator n=1 Tax=unclassified Amycolatopsis TaxID=2618356 RepID=UPI003671CB9A